MGATAGRCCNGVYNAFEYAKRQWSKHLLHLCSTMLCVPLMNRKRLVLCLQGSFHLTGATCAFASSCNTHQEQYAYTRRCMSPAAWSVQSLKAACLHESQSLGTPLHQHYSCRQIVLSDFLGQLTSRSGLAQKIFGTPCMLN